MQIWYSWKGGREGEFPSDEYLSRLNESMAEKTLQVVTQKQRAKVEEIKKKTNYDSTRSLLEKYADPSTPMRRRLSPSQPRTPLPVTPQPYVRTPIAQQRNQLLQLSRAYLRVG